MISRKKILSRSRDILDDYYDNGDGAWFHVDKLFSDHIQEVLTKYDQLDDEIWAKIIVMERNRRVAKAYARAPTISINGSDAGFDGYRIGMNGFPSQTPDAKTQDIKRTLAKGVKLKMDDSGNILIKKLTRTPVFIKGYTSKSENPTTAINKNHSSSSTSDHSMDSSTSTDSSICLDLIKANGRLEGDSAVKMFDMSRFSHNVDRELRNAYPDRRRLERQCISIIAFGRDSSDILNLPCFVMMINIVAIDMLKTRVPTGLLDNTNLLNNSKITMTRFACSFDDDDDGDLDLDKDEEIYSSSKTDSTGSSGTGGRLLNGKAASIIPQIRNGSTNSSTYYTKSNNSSSKIPGRFRKTQPPISLQSSFISSTSSSTGNEALHSNGGVKNSSRKSWSSKKGSPPKLPPRDFQRKLLPRLPTPDYDS